MTGFYTHRKTARLRAALGPASDSDAFWIPPRLWAYAAENQPDGDLSGYTSEELATLIGCSKHATSILQALKDSGFVDPSGVIHDWEEHNGYHKKYAERAKTAAAARWGKEKKEPKKRKSTRKGESGDKHCLGHACSIPTSLNGPDFTKWWDKWVAHRMTIKKPKDWNALFQDQLDWLAKYPAEKAVQILEQSVINGYQGLFEPKGQNASNPRRTHSAAYSGSVEDNPRNAGTCKPVTDYAAEAAKRQQQQRDRIENETLARQVAANEPETPAAKGNG